MTAFTLTIDGHRPLTGDLQLPDTVRFVGFRCLHRGEGGYPSALGMPCVRPSVNAPAIPFTREMQLLSYALNRHNPAFTGDKWRSVYWTDRAFTNGNGFDEPGDPRADFVNNRDVNDPLPALMKAIICGGSFYRGDVVGNELVCRPGVHAIDARRAMPSVEQVLANNWYFVATTGGDRVISNFPQGDGRPVLIPYFLTQPTPYPLSWFVPWNETFLPDPLRLYRPL